MPELPEVEALVQFLAERATDRTVTELAVGTISALKTYAPPPDALVGRTVLGAHRHGKWIDLVTGPGPQSTTEAQLHLVVHLSRAGWLRWHDQVPATPVRPGRSPVALRIRFDDGSGFALTEAGTRKRLAVHVVEDLGSVPPIASLGVDPLGEELTVDRLAELLAARNQQIKGALRDQHVVAGIGNAYSDEILHAARMSPFAMTSSLGPDDVARLHTVIRDVLTQALATAGGRPAAELKDAKRRGMQVHGRTGEACPVCGDTVREVSFADSALQYCPTCQTRGRVLADRRMSRLLR